MTYTLEQCKKFSAEIEGYENGEELEYKSSLLGWIKASSPTFNINTEFRIKPKLTREKITANLVKENNLKIGDKVKVHSCNHNGVVIGIYPRYIKVKNAGNIFYYNVESLEKLVIQQSVSASA